MTDVLAEAHDYLDLHRAMRARAETQQMTRAALEQIVGPSLARSLFAAPRTNMGIVSFGLVLQALGLKLLVVEDPEMMAKILPRITPRDESKVHILNRGKQAGTKYRFTFSFTREELRRMGRKGGKRKLETLPPWRRTHIARMAARARWKRVRDLEKQEEAKRKAKRAAQRRQSSEGLAYGA